MAGRGLLPSCRRLPLSSAGTHEWDECQAVVAGWRGEGCCHRAGGPAKLVQAHVNTIKHQGAVARWRRKELLPSCCWPLPSSAKGLATDVQQAELLLLEGREMNAAILKLAACKLCRQGDTHNTFCRHGPHTTNRRRRVGRGLQHRRQAVRPLATSELKQGALGCQHRCFFGRTSSQGRQEWLSC